MKVASQVGFRELLQPYKRTEIAKGMRTTRARVDKWANGLSYPAINELPELATFIRVPLDFLVASIAIDQASANAQSEPAA